MAYGERYFVTYCDSYGIPGRISILENNFTGAAEELTGGEDPILITYDSPSDFVYEPIRPSSAQINLVFDSNFQMEGMWTADERKYQVIHYINGNVDWIGWVIPDGFEHEYHGGIYMASITASDTLSTLEKLQFVYDDGNTYGRQDLTYNNGDLFPYSLICTEILRKLDLNINTWIAYDVWELSMNVAANYHNNNRTADPYSLAYLNVRTFINDSDRKDIPYWQNADEAWNCKDVIENVLRQTGCTLYQESGTWRIIRPNIHENYNPNNNGFIRQWIKYNTLNVYVGKENVQNEQIIENSTLTSAMIGDDHVMRMDDVYAAYRLNYEFQFTREGDNAINIIKNPGFTGSGFQTPTQGISNWIRWRNGNKWFPRARTVNVTPGQSGSSNLPPQGITKALEMGTHNPGVSTSKTDPNAAIWAAIEQNPPPTVVKGDKMRLSMWIKMTERISSVSYYGVLKIKIVVPGEGTTYYLVNSNENFGGTINNINTTWLKESVPNLSGLDRWFLNVTPDNNSTQYNWQKVSFNVPDIPDNGILYFDIHGLAASRGRESSNFRPFKVKPWFQTGGSEVTLPTVRKDWIDDGGNIPRFQITDIRFEVVKPNTEDFIEELDYIYYNPNPTYTYNPDPVRIYNGDLQNENHISTIVVPTRTSGKNFWFPVSVGNYQNASLGLITAQSIMNQYYRPNRILEGTVKADTTASFSSRFGFYAIPGIRFVLMRATFNKKRNYIQDATFRQITTIPGEEGCPGSENPNEPEPEIPGGGGEEGGIGVDPEWVSTGNVRCRKIDHLNTGEVEIQERDKNPNSETYNQNRWVIDGTDTNMCPVGDPSQYWWGADVAGYDPNNFQDAPFFTDDDYPNEVQVNYNNDGDKYLYFLHRAGLGFGLVERIYTAGQPQNIISDWQYLPDTVINGYTYRVLRTNYVLAEFSDFSFNFVFST